MTNDTTPPAGDATRTQQRYTLYCHADRVLARNVDGKLIDLGALSRDADGSWHYLLDGNQLEGGGMLTAQAALREIGERMGFLYLDGQFTAVADLREGSTPDLSNAEQLEVTLDELQRGERMEDARV
jgi:hypothetical protein